MLGPLEVRDGERVLPLGGSKRRALAALLLLAENRPVPASSARGRHVGRATARRGGQLAAEPGLAPARGAGRRGWRAASSGYLLRVEPGELDLERFRRLARAQRRRGAGDRGAPARSPRPLARPGRRRPGGRARPRRRRAPGRAAPDHSGAARRRRPRRRPPGRARARTGGAHRRAPLPRAPLGPARARPLSRPAARPPRWMPTHVRAGRSSTSSAPSPAPRCASCTRKCSATTPRSARPRHRPHPSLPRLVCARHGARSRCSPARSRAARRPTPRRVARRCGGSRGGGATIERHGGTPASAASGERCLGVFGAPRAHEDDALRAVRAAFELSTDGTTVAVGVATGEVIAGSPGAGDALVSGAPLDLADRLRTTGGPGVLVSERTAPGAARGVGHHRTLTHTG